MLANVDERTHERRAISRTLLAILGIAFALRAVCAIFFTGMIDSEGAEYARIAQNLLAGVGYVGIATEGPQLFFPPLFPYLIAALSYVTGDAESAGRLVSVVMGSLIVVPVYLIARRMYGERIAIAAAALVGVHPLLVQYSTTVFCETTYMTLILLAISMAMRVMDSPTVCNTCLTGAFYGLAYLVRPEALAYMLVAIGFIAFWIAFKGGRRRIALLCRLPLIPLVFLLLAAPYIAWLSEQTGRLRLEAKTPLNIATELRIQQGQSIDEAAFGVDPDLTARGIWIQPNLPIVKAEGPGIGVLARMLAKKARSVVIASSAALAGNPGYGAPALFVLAVLGLFARPWSPRLAMYQLHIMVILGLVLFGSLFIYYSTDRFYLLFIPFFCIWASVGVVQFSRWAKRSAALSGVGQTHLLTVGKVSRALALAAIILPSAAYALSGFISARGERSFKEASISLAAGQMAPMRIASTFTMVAFHARADFIWLPYSDEATALRFLEKSAVTHVVLRDEGLDARPYLKKWLASGVPNARQVVAAVAATGERLKVYQFER